MYGAYTAGGWLLEMLDKQIDSTYNSWFVQGNQKACFVAIAYKYNV